MSDDYDREGIIEAFITNLGKYNEGALAGEWLSFPAAQEEVKKAIEKIGIGAKDEFGIINNHQVGKNW